MRNAAYVNTEYIKIASRIGYLFGRPSESKLLFYVCFNFFAEVRASVTEPLSAFGFSMCGSGIIIEHSAHKLPAISAYFP